MNNYTCFLWSEAVNWCYVSWTSMISKNLREVKITQMFDILVVSVAWSSNVASYKLFSTIFKSIKGVVVDEVKSARNVSKDKLIIK
jgi:hypothetical protein